MMHIFFVSYTTKVTKVVILAPYKEGMAVDSSCVLYYIKYIYFYCSTYSVVL